MGPFGSWRHRHLFLAEDGRTRLVDSIDFELPPAPVGEWLAARVAPRQLNPLLAYRHAVTKRYCQGSFPAGGG